MHLLFSSSFFTCNDFGPHLIKWRGELIDMDSISWSELLSFDQVDEASLKDGNGLSVMPPTPAPAPEAPVLHISSTLATPSPVPTAASAASDSIVVEAPAIKWPTLVLPPAPVCPKVSVSTPADVTSSLKTGATSPPLDNIGKETAHPNRDADSSKDHKGALAFISPVFGSKTFFVHLFVKSCSWRERLLAEFFVGAGEEQEGRFRSAIESSEATRGQG